MSVWTNPNELALNKYVVSIFGDLRDRYDAESIIKWFEDKCSTLWVKNATITASDEDYTYSSTCIDELTFVEQKWIHSSSKGVNV